MLAASKSVGCADRRALHLGAYPGSQHPIPRRTTETANLTHTLDDYLKTMSTTEVLIMQLDQLRTQYNLLDAQNRRLREEQPQRAEELDLEGEITETQQNVGLVQTIATLEAKLEDRERGQGHRRTNWSLSKP